MIRANKKLQRALGLTTPNKYGNTRVEYAGMSFASKGELMLYQHLKQKEYEGKLRDLKCQVRVKLTEAEIVYIPDFSAIDTGSNELLYFEFKGMNTDVWNIKKKLYKFYGPAPLFIYNRRVNNLILVEEIYPKLLNRPENL